jgi:heptosyltransferase-3
MKIANSVNSFRRHVTQKITKNIGRSSLSQISRTIKVEKILICRPNHRLGNMLLITPLVQDVALTFPGCQIDLFVKGNIAPAVFKNFPEVHQIIMLPKRPFQNLLQYMRGWLNIRRHHYDLVINVDMQSSSGRLSTKFARSSNKFFGDNRETFSNLNDHKHMGKFPVYGFRNYIAGLSGNKAELPVPPLKLSLSAFEIEQGQKKLGEIANRLKATICLYTFATGGKCYSKVWWQAFYDRLKKACPNYNIIEVLPIENVSQIDFAAPSCYSTNIREIAALIANTQVFITGDCGIMHLASAVSTPVIALFSVTDSCKYAPYNDHSVALNTNEVEIEEIMKAVAVVLENKVGVSLSV